MTEYNLFCWAEKYNNDDSFQQKRWRAFNKEVGEDRWGEIRDEVRGILSDLKLELNKKTWAGKWKKVKPEQWKRILEIPEADKDIIEKIVGFELPKSESKMITIKGKKYSEDTLAEALKEYVN